MTYCPAHGRRISNINSSSSNTSNNNSINSSSTKQLNSKISNISNSMIVAAEDLQSPGRHLLRRPPVPARPTAVSKAATRTPC